MMCIPIVSIVYKKHGTYNVKHHKYQSKVHLKTIVSEESLHIFYCFVWTTFNKKKNFKENICVVHRLPYLALKYLRFNKVLNHLYTFTNDWKNVYRLNTIKTIQKSGFKDPINMSNCSNRNSNAILKFPLHVSVILVMFNW